tara:strand:+ start:697 stop:978 length:282 start_codon:yes stop_codon:yes gene_type:complete
MEDMTERYGLLYELETKENGKKKARGTPYTGRILAKTNKVTGKINGESGLVKDGKRIGVWKQYREGILEAQGEYLNGKKKDKWLKFKEKKNRP